MTQGLRQQKLAVDSTYWPLYRFDPRLRAQGKNPLQLDSGPAKITFKDYANNEQRYRMLAQSYPAHADELMAMAQTAVTEHYKRYEELAK